MTRLRFLVRRLGQALITLWAITLLTFLMFKALPGSVAFGMLGVRATNEDIAKVNAQLGLDRPIWQQYGTYMKGLFHGDLGQSVTYGKPAADVIGVALPTTIFLAVYAVVLTAIITVVLAVIAALRRDKPVDHAIRAVPVVGLGMPAFWVGTMLLFLLAYKLPIFPAGGLEPGFTGHLKTLFLPAVTLSVLYTAVLVRSLRASLLEVLDSEYVLAARAKGLVGRRLILRHVLPNAVLPTITLLGLIFAGLLGGALIVESVFALPGLGSLLITGFNRHDFALVQGIILISSVAILAVNILIDILYSAIDPRVGLK
jgi:peptide/nickel transport system permease protein